ncbi:MAG: hypothetical protein PHU14_07710 [Methylovulum sp.]|nr:hypothetical protein [Methylovulum sp.]
MKKHDRLRQICLAIAKKLGVFDWLLSYYFVVTGVSQVINMQPVMDQAHLQFTSRTLHIYADLTDAIKKQKGGW